MDSTSVKKNYPMHSDGRLLDGPLLIFDLPLLMDKITNESYWIKGQRNAITLLKSESMRLVLIALREEASIDFRQSGNLISLQLLKGRLTFKAANQTIMLLKDQVLTLHENIQHSLTANEESIFLLSIANGSSEIEIE